METTFITATGAVRLRDAMAFADGQRGHELGLDVPARGPALGGGRRRDGSSSRWSWRRDPSTG